MQEIATVLIMRRIVHYGDLIVSFADVQKKKIMKARKDFLCELKSRFAQE